jgi:hypothetical protein
MSAAWAKIDAAQENFIAKLSRVRRNHLTQAAELSQDNPDVAKGPPRDFGLRDAARQRLDRKGAPLVQITQSHCARLRRHPAR